MFLRWQPRLDLAAVDDEEDDQVRKREDFIETDASAFTFAPLTAGAGRLIIESGYSFLSFGHEGGKHSFPETTFRYGIGDRLELRFGYNYETGKPTEAPEGDIAGNFGINAQQQVYYGFKYAISRDDPDLGFIPHSAFLAQAHTPIGSIEVQTQIRLGYAWGWRLPNGWTLDQAMRFGTDREGHDNYDLWAPSTILRIPLGPEKRWFTLLEYFSISSSGKVHNFSKQFIDTGLHYFITPNFEVGGDIALGLNQQARGVIANAGFGIRF